MEKIGKFVLASIFAKETWYFMRIGNSFKKTDSTSESLSMKAKMEVDSNLRKALTDADNGILRSGALPKMSMSSAAGNKQILDALNKACEFTLQDYTFKKRIPSTYKLFWLDASTLVRRKVSSTRSHILFFETHLVPIPNVAHIDRFMLSRKRRAKRGEVWNCMDLPEGFLLRVVVSYFLVLGCRFAYLSLYLGFLD